MNAKILVTLCLTVSLASVAAAAVIESDSWEGGTAPTIPSIPNTKQLNLDLSGTVTQGSLVGQEGTGTNVATLSNGSTGTGNFNNDVTSGQVVSISNSTDIVYTFPHDVIVFGIDTTTEWRDYGRINQNYTVLTSTDGVNFTPLHTVAYDAMALVPMGTGNVNTEVELTAGGGQALGLVKAIEFQFGSQQNGYVGFTQLAIVGVPEPSSVVLAGIGIVGLIVTVARRRRARTSAV